MIIGMIVMTEEVINVINQRQIGFEVIMPNKYGNNT